MAHLNKSQCAYDGKLNLNELCTIIISKKKNLKAFLIIQKQIQSILYDQINCSRFSVHDAKKSGVHYLVTVLTEGTRKSSPSDERSKLGAG